MKKITFLLIALLAVFASCSKENVNPNPEPEPEPEPSVEYPKFIITSQDTSVSIFQNVLASLQLEGEEANDLKTGIFLMAAYDSIIWEIPKQYYQPEPSTNYSIKVGFAFPFPGTYKLYVSGYKNKAIVRRDSINFIVKNSRDFLGLNWKAGKDETFNSAENSYTKTLLNLKSDITGDKPTARLEFMYSSSSGRDQYSIISYNTLTECINKNYGESQFTYTGDLNKSNLVAKYAELFKNPLESRYFPVKIWQTEKNNIVLLGMKEGSEERIYYVVKAEPRS